MVEQPERIWIWFADNGNIRKWQKSAFSEGTEYVRADLHAALAQERDRLAAENGELRTAIEKLVSAKALKGVRELVAGWNGENRPDGPYTERHPNRLGATLPKTNCGAVYELDEAMQEARALLSRQADGGE